MYRNSVTGGGSLKAKLLNSMMAVVLVLGLTPISNSYATSSSDAESGQAIEQQADSSPKSAAEAKASDGDSDSSKSADQSAEEPSGNSDDSSSKAASGNSEAASSEGDDDSSSQSNGDSGAANSGNNAEENSSQSGESDGSEEGLSDSVSGTYNPDADFVDISNNCKATVDLFKDASHNTPLGDTAITSAEKFYAQLQLNFIDNYRPTLSNPNVMYKFPANVKVANMAETDLMDGTKLAGKWYIEDVVEDGVTYSVAYFKYNEDYLNSTVTHAYAKLDCELNGVNKGDGSSEAIKFPGTSTSVTVNTKDGSVSGSKFGGDMSQTWNGPTYDQATNSYTWTIKISPNAYATDVKIADTIGSNLTFVDGSFKLVDASGQETSGTCEATVSGQNATISLGDLTAGDYYVQYKTTVNSLPDADNTAISDADNKATYSWGASDNRQKGDISKSPQNASYSMVSKSADGSSTPSAIKWVVKLNNGSIKADMGGYTFTDKLGSDQTFVTSTGVTVTDSDGKSVTVIDSSMTSSALTFKLPADAGEKQYTVVYYTQMTNQDSKDAVKNTAEVTPSDPTHGPEGTGTGTYNPPDSGTYITKALTSDISSANYDGKASWKSEILFSDMAANTNPTTIVFTDEFSQLPSDVKVSLDGDVKLTVGDGGAALVEGTDYSIDKATGEQWPNNKLFTVTFKDSDTVKSLIGQADAKVVVTYSTLTSQVSGEYPAGTYKNKSSVKTDKKSTVSAEENYIIEKEATPPAVIKDGTNSSWDADYTWSDGTKGAWITNWTAYVNRTSKSDGSAAIDLGGKDVTVTDTLPADSLVVTGSAKYKLMDKSGYNGSIEQSIDFTSSDGSATFVIPTKDAKYSWGSDMGTQVSVALTYQTATKGSIDSKAEITNTAQAASGSYEFPEGSSKVTFDNKALAKTGDAVSGSSAREYTITVNENAYDLVSDSDTLTLVDDLDYRGELSASTISVKSAEGIDLLATGQASYELAKIGEGGNTHTRLTIKVPDSTKVIVTYKVVPSGKEGDEMKDFSNSCELSGVKNSVAGVTETFNVATSSGGTGSESWGITLIKTDSSGKKNLEGATFELWKVDLDESTKGNIVAEKVDTQTSDDKGKVSFGDEDNPLASNTLYYFVETVAPAGYEISYTGNTYVMLKSDATKDDYDAAYEKATKLEVTPSLAVSYTAYDELEKGSFDLEIEKKVEGAEAPANATFTFKAEATGDNAKSAPELADVSIATDAKGEKTYTGKFTGSLSDSMKDQTFTYKVSETGTAPGGWTYDPGEYTATVQVVEQDGKLVGNVSYAKGDATADKMSFTNTYKTTGTPVLHVKKAVNGGAADSKFKDKTFTFYVYNADSEGKKTGEPIQHVNVSAGKTAYINGLGTYTAPGTYRYVIQEASVSDAGWTLANDVSVTVTATDNGTGSLVLSYDYSTHPADDENAALFDNTYTEATSANLQAKKILTGRDMSNDEFSFQLIDQNEGEHKGEVIDTKTSSASRDGVATTVDFDALSFDEPGTYTYGIQEQIGSLAHVTYDTSIYTAQVVVTKDDATGRLSAVVQYLKAGEQLDSAPTFNNTYTAPADGKFQLKVKKTVNGATPKSGESFTFSAKYESGYEGAKELDGFIKDATTDSTGMATFDTVSLGEEFYGKEFVLRIHETDQLSKEWTKGLDVLATVSVSQPTGSEEPTVTVKYDKAETQYASFDNTYSTSTNATLSVHKEVTGATDVVKGKEFTFALYEQGRNEVLQTKSAKADETVSFEALEFAQAGEYKYDIKELGEDGQGWTYAQPTTATVTVTENADRSLSATVSYDRATDDETAALFTNTYKTEGTATIQVYKTVNGGTEAKPGEKFTFDLYKADSEGKATGDVLGTVETEMGKVASFDSVALDAEGTYTYVIKETGHNDKGWTAASDVTATVKVTDNGDGTLKTEITYSNTVEGAAGFDDVYTAAGELILNVAKTVNHGELSPDQEFEFGLYETDESGAKIGDPIATVSLKAGETKSLDGVFYDFGNNNQTYTYIISELTELGEGWTKASDQKVTVKVSDAGDGVMNAEVVYEGDGDAALFDNTYTEPEQPVTPSEDKEKKSSSKSSSKKSEAKDSEKDSTAKTGDDTLFAAGAASALAVAAAGASVLARRRRRD